MMNLEFFERLSPNFSLICPFADHVYVEDINIEDGQIGSWLRQVNSDALFKEKIINFIKNKQQKQKSAIILINSTINQIRCIFIYLLVRSQKTNTIEIKFYNLLEIANMINQCFSKDLWSLIDSCIVDQRDSLIQRNLQAGYIALEPFFTLCHGDFQEYGKIKYDFGNVLFYLNDKYNWGRSNAGICANSGRVLIQQLGKGKKLVNIPEKITRQCLANHQLENNVFVAL